MTNVLADLAVESEAATAAAMRLARAFDADADDEHEQRIKRLVTPVIKYWTCKRAPQHAAEALECLGGAGYVEESDLPAAVPAEPAQRRLGRVGQRHLPRRAARHRPRTGRRSTRYWDEVSLAAGADRRLDDSIAMLRKECDDLDQIESRARRLVEHLALVFQGSLLVRHAPAAVADAFCASRLAGDTSHAFGTMPPGIDMQLDHRPRPPHHPVRTSASVDAVGRLGSAVEVAAREIAAGFDECVVLP